MPGSLFPVRFDFELEICSFRSQKMEASAYAARTCKIRPDFFESRIRWPKPSDFDSKADNLGYDNFKSKNGMIKIQDAIYGSKQQQYSDR